MTSDPDLSRSPRQPATWAIVLAALLLCSIVGTILWSIVVLVSALAGAIQ